MATDYGPWEPLTIPAIAAEMVGFARPWWVAGGYALEALAGRSWRGHGDVDVGLFGEDATAVRAHLAGWEAWAAWPAGTLVPWPAGEPLPGEAHDIWVRRDAGSPWAIQLMFDRRDGDDWVFRRDAAVRLPAAELTWERDGVRYIRPEVQLLYKAKGQRPKDEADFAEVAPLLGPAERRWLREQLERLHPGHAWLGRLPAG